MRKIPPPTAFSRHVVMASALVASGCLTLVPSTAQERPVPSLIPRRPAAPETLSSSKQFLAHGGTQYERAEIIAAAELIREEFSALLDRQNAGDVAPQSGTPLVIDLWLQPGARPPVQPRLYIVEGQTTPTLGLVLESSPQAQSEEFRQEVIRLLLIERIVRSNLEIDFTQRSQVLPHWVFVGVKEAMDYVRLGRPSARFAAMFQAGASMPIEELLTADPQRLPAPRQEIFNLSACSLIMLLFEQPQGASRFRQFLAHLPRHGSSYENQLVRAFPGLALSKHSLEKWWALQNSLLAQPSIYEKLSVGATEKKLVQALTLRWQPPAADTSPGLATRAARASTTVGKWFKKWLPKRKPEEGAEADAETAASSSPPETEGTPVPAPELEVIPLTSIEGYLRAAQLPEESRRQAVQGTQMELAALALEAYPLYQPVLDGYQQTLGFLIDGKVESLSPILEALVARRAELQQIAEAMEDYLNWYEATQRKGLTGAFEGYFRLFEQLSKPPTRPPDPFSIYLDEIEEEFAKK